MPVVARASILILTAAASWAALAADASPIASTGSGSPRPATLQGTMPLGRGVDPANVAGVWDYRTRSNCGRSEGVGEVSFTWNAGASGYDERGFVRWPTTGQVIRWWGVVRFQRSTRRLVGRMQNTLGDFVDANWQLEGQGPDRLVVHWRQTNGCRGTGIATRRP